MNIKFNYNEGVKYPWQWYYSPQGAEFFELTEWLYQTYGPTGDTWNMRGGWIMFRDQKDVTLFMLRWV